MSIVARAKELRRAGQPDAAVAVLVDALRRGLLPALEVEEAGRFLQGLVDKGLVPTPKLRVRVVGQCTTAWLKNVLTAESWARGAPAVVSEGGYDQVFQDVFSIRPGEVDVLVLLPWVAQRPVLDTLLDDAAVLGDTVDAELGLWRQVWAHAGALGLAIVQVGYDVPGTGALGLRLGASRGPRALVRALDAAVSAALPAGAWFLDLETLAGTVGRERFYDARRWHWTRQPFSEAGIVRLAGAVWAGVRAVRTGPKKVLVLDCDNTLWGGVVGETGPLGIELGEGADGQAFRTFQAWCKAAARRGVVLAVATKNEPDDARGPFEQNPNMALRLSDIAAFEAGWGPKSESLKRIAEQLSLGLDSFVFVDDNPAEREQVRQALPDVEVVELPADPSAYVAAVEAGLWFEAVSLTAEDAARSVAYQEERARRELQSSFTSLDDYLTSLDMIGDVRTVDETDLSRVVQLLGKTNQFNVTSRRHPSSYVEQLVADPRAAALTLRIADRFGDHGLVAVALAEPVDDHTLRVDTFLMSCRVIARTAEDHLFNAVLDHARQHGFTTLVAEYLPTKKNAQVAELWARFGFEHAGPASEDAAGTVWRLDVPAAAPSRSFVRRAGQGDT